MPVHRRRRDPAGGATALVSAALPSLAGPNVTAAPRPALLSLPQGESRVRWVGLKRPPISMPEGADFSVGALARYFSPLAGEKGFARLWRSQIALANPREGTVAPSSNLRTPLLQVQTSQLSPRPDLL